MDPSIARDKVTLGPNLRLVARQLRPVFHVDKIHPGDSSHVSDQAPVRHEGDESQKDGTSWRAVDRFVLCRHGA